jgi:hypothetical protein
MAPLPNLDMKNSTLSRFFYQLQLSVNEEVKSLLITKAIIIMATSVSICYSNTLLMSSIARTHVAYILDILVAVGVLGCRRFGVSAIWG